MNTNKEGKRGGAEGREEDLPKIDLPKGSQGALPAGRAGNRVTLSVRKAGESVQYFIENRPVRYEELVSTLQSRRISSLRVRFDERLLYRDYVRILNLCKEVGISEIINVYTSRKQRRGQ